ncbi:hypothetical protein [Mucilaginibacter sp.]
MKKAILIGLMSITSISFAQTKETAKYVRTEKQAKPYLDSLKKLNKQGVVLDSVNATNAGKLTYGTQKLAPKLVIQYEKSDAINMLGALKTGYIAMSESDQISAKQYSHAKKAYEDLMLQIYITWPDLIPKQAKQ